MSRTSWSHAVRVLPDDELAHAARLGRTCSTPRCTDPPTHATSYSYVTGRTGRVCATERLACPVHAQRFAQRHGLDLPTEPRPGWTDLVDLGEPPEVPARWRRAVTP